MWENKTIKKGFSTPTPVKILNTRFQRYSKHFQ